MDVLKPVLLFISGLVVASVFFLLHMDRWMPHFGGGERAIVLAIQPPGAPGEDACPVTYAVDNRTDHLVVLALAGSAGPYSAPAPDGSQWNNQPYDRRYDSRPAPRASADMFGFGGDTVPESSEPGVHSTEDGFPDDSNYGGSLSEYGNDGGRGARPDEYAYGEGSSYAQPGSYGAAPGAYQGSSAASPGYFSSDRSNIPPPPPGQPIPLTPGDNSSPYGAPATPGYGDPNDPNWQPQGSPIRPGEIFFASTAPSDNPDGQQQNCDPSASTVNVQLSN
jgi:hypothetical protein